MPRWAHNKMPASVKQRYFELLRQGYKGAAAARVVGVSTQLRMGAVLLEVPDLVSKGN
ncbi:MAG TPA: hypothetical protein VLW50_10060 [Streptosporangiaceae bacterium]|nr:hypothetical protein [Streptosporangiaceae bacterium]